ncbi:MAG: heparinase II/III family protein [Vicinamibacteria bacterium]
MAVAVGFAGATPLPAAPPEPRRLVEHAVEGAGLDRVLVPREAFRPYPPSSDHAAWERLVPEETRRAFVAAADKELATPWAELPATRFLDFVRDGNRGRYEKLLFSRRAKLGRLVLGETLEGKGRFAEAIADGVWLLCEESFWGVPAHVGMQKKGAGLPDVTEPIVDLFAAETGALLAWTDFLVGERLDAVHPMVRERLRLEVDRRILTPALERDDFGWMGFRSDTVNNWNPWINSNWLAAALLVERDPARRTRAVAKIARSLDRFVDGYPDDGGCDEGPSYWGRAGASLFEALELLRTATAGHVDVFHAPVVRAIGRYIASAHVASDWYVNIGDASARVSPDPDLVFRYGRATGDDTLAAFGAWLAARRGPYGPDDVDHFGSPARALAALAATPGLASTPAAEPLPGEAWLPDLQMMAAREKPGTTDGLYVAAWGGHNGQSHNHNDVGNVIVFAAGRPLLVDAGVGEYTAKTFSPQRYDIWTMQSSWHVLPTVNGADERAGAQFEARDVSFAASPTSVRFALDIAPAWAADAGVTRYRREVALDRKRGEVVLAEDYALVACREPLRLRFLAAAEPDVSVPGRVALRAGGPAGGAATSYVLQYDASRFAASVETKAIEDARLAPVWGDRLFRLTLAARACAASGRHRVVVRRAR